MLKDFSNDLYHRLLRLSWTRLVLLFFVFFSVVVVGFGFLYQQVGGIEGTRPGSLLDHIWFSVHTISTIGYGALNPVSAAANFLVAIEAFTGVLGFAVATGMVFAKFSRPTARIRFSEVVTIHERNGVPTLHLRMANKRITAVMEATVKLYLVRDETTEHGRQMRRFYQLDLARSETPVFGYSFTVMHRLDGASPLQGVSPDNLEDQLTNLIVTLNGIDDEMVSEVHARHVYNPEDIRFGERFVDIIEFDGPGMPESLDVDNIDETERVTP